MKIRSNTKNYIFMRSLICIILWIPISIAIFSPQAQGNAVGRFDVDINIEGIPQQDTVSFKNSSSFPFIVEVEGKGNYAGKMNVNLDCTSSNGHVEIEERSISIANGETKQVEGAFSKEDIVENMTISISVSAEISNEGNIGPGAGAVKTDSKNYQVTVLPEESDEPTTDDAIRLTQSSIIILAIIAFIIFISNAVGGLIPYLGKWDKKTLVKFTLVGGGVIFSLSLFSILPESIKVGGGIAILGFLAGIPLLFGIGQLTKMMKSGASGVANVVIGINIHEISEGVLLSLAVILIAGTRTPLVWALGAISLNALPVAFSYISHIRAKNVPARLTLTYFVIYLLSLPIGIIIGVTIFKTIPLELVGSVFGLTGGMLLTLSITEMSPISWEEKKFLSPAIFYFIIGALLMAALLIFL